MRAVKTDFLISPAYDVPPIRTSRSSNDSRMKASLRVPSISGIAWKRGALMTVNAGMCSARSPGSWICRNMLRANSECQASSVITRTGRRYLGSAPAWQSWMKTSRPGK